MATALPHSAYSTRRNSLHLDDYADSKSHSRQLSSRGIAINHAHDGKIAVQDPSLLAASRDADSMKYAIVDPPPSSKATTDYPDLTFGDFGQSLIDDDYLKGFGLIGPQSKTASPNSRSASRNPSRGHSRGNSRAPDPFFAAPVQSVYELDVPGAGFTYPSPERGRLRPAELGPSAVTTPKQSSEMARLKTPETAPVHGGRKGSIPAIKASPDSTPVKVKRLSGFSLKSVKSAFSRNDYPEVVQPPSPSRQPRTMETRFQPSRETDRALRNTRPQQESVPPTPRAPQSNGHSQFNTRQPRAMASTPQLHQQVPPSPAVPRPWMTRRPSASSLRSTMSNINKPLPPEPGQIPIEQYHSSRTPTTPRAPLGSSRTPTTISPSKPWQEIPQSPSAHQYIRPSRRIQTAPSQANQLRSRYTPKDLDALDDAFQKSTPAGPKSAGIYGATLIAPHDGLDPIRESPQGSQQHLDINAPLQIARGPGRMEPSRRPPPTPGSRSRSPVSHARSGPSTPEPPWQPPQRENVASQSVQASRRPSEARADPSTMHLGGGPAKVQQILGEGNRGTEPPLESERAVDRATAATVGKPYAVDNPGEPILSQQTMPAQQLLLGSAPTQTSQMGAPVDEVMARSESLSSHQGAFRIGGTSDVHFDEIRRRLELLSPTTATDTSFITTQLVGQMLSNQIQTLDVVEPAPPEPQTQRNEPPVAPAEQTTFTEPEVFAGELPGDTVRIQSMAPVELPVESTWANTLAGLYEMAGSASPRVSVQPATPAGLANFVPPAPPPVPESPTRDSRRIHSHTQSMLSSGSGRTKSIRSMKSARSARSAKARSITSAAASEIPELYAGLPSPRTTLGSRRQSMLPEDSDIPEVPPMPEIATTEELEQMDDVISADVAEQVLYQILRNLLDPLDLLSASLVSRGFQRTFRRHDTKLLRNSLWYSSPAAWEYLEMHMPISSETGQLEYPPDVYRQQWVDSMSCLTKLKAMILHHCGRSLSPITALMLEARDSKHSAPVDDAIWRIWTFCKIFGEDEYRREDLELQKQWIKGQTIVEAQARSTEPRSISPQDYPAFGFGNDEGLSPEELMRIGEIWLCLRVLVRGYRGKRREAREFGIFEGADVRPGDAGRENAILDEWTVHLLSLAPGTNLQVLCPQTATQENFITAESLGYTNWTPPGVHYVTSGFLVGPICSVLEEWLTNDIRANVRASQGAVHPAFRNQQQIFPSRQQVGLFVDRLRTVKDVLVSPGEERPTSSGSAEDAEPAQPAGKPTIIATGPKPETIRAIAPSKSVKEGKKGFAGFSSKLSLRLPSRSLTSAKQAKLQAPPLPTPRAPSADSTAQGEPVSPTDSVKSSRLFSRSKSTKEKPSARSIFHRNPTKSRKDGNSKTPSQEGGLLATNGASEAPSREGSRGNPAPNTKSRPGSYITDYDKLPVYPEAQGIPTDPNSNNPRALARKELIGHGYEVERVDAILDECTTGNRVDFDRALKKLKKSKRLEDRLKRLDRMG